MLKIKNDTLSQIFSTIKKGIQSIAQSVANDKDNAIIAAALIGKEVEYISAANSVSTYRRPKGTIIGYKRATSSVVTIQYQYYYFYSETAAPLLITVKNLKTILTNYSTYNSSPNKLISKTNWSKFTPFIDPSSVISAITKGETVNGWTKWIIFLLEDSEDQTYTAYKTGNTKYIYGKYDFVEGRPQCPWEVWIPSSAATGSVVVDW